MKKIIGIDVGGTRIKGGLFYDGYLKKSSKAPANGQVSREAIVKAIQTTIDEIWEDDVSQIGIVSAGNIDPEKGLCTLSYNLKGWTGCPIKEIFESLYHRPVYVDNDAIGALLGEMTLLSEKKNVTMLTFGTGIGGASIIDGRLSRDPKTAWGHVVMIPNGRECICGKKGCSECYLSANALMAMAKKEIPSLTSTIELDDLYRRKDPKALAIMAQYGIWLNLFLQQIEDSVHPTLLILGGGLMNAKMMRKIVTLPPEKYAFAQLGNLAGVVGAASLPFSN